MTRQSFCLMLMSPRWLKSCFGSFTMQAKPASPRPSASTFTKIFMTQLSGAIAAYAKAVKVDGAEQGTASFHPEQAAI
jgi:hypothetical protein